MDSFVFYHTLRSIKDVLSPYSSAEKVCKEIDDALEQLTSKKYRVAVIGEFKRGKSSLINTLLGTEVLPTDILPATAVVNKIVYDENQKIEITYYDGKHEETSIEKLKDFATKFDEKNTARVSEIKEITVHYPSVLGQNNIVLYDTPGLNDDDNMTKKTIEILDEIDTAIVVISATMPLSMTEKNLICTLLEQDDIYHIVFVASFIDRVSDDEDEQNRVVDLIAERISEDTYEMFASNHSENNELMNKAKRILKEPDVFAVSSKQAMQGIIKDDKTLLRMSRFPSFKLKIISLLTAKQSLFINDKAKRLIEKVQNDFDNWVNDEVTKCNDKIENESKKLKQLKDLSNERQNATKLCYRNMEKVLLKNNFSNVAGDIKYLLKEVAPYKYFVDELKLIKTDDYNVASIESALSEAIIKVNKRCDEVTADLEKMIVDEMINTKKITDDFDKKMNLELSDYLWHENHRFPKLEIINDDFFPYIINILGNIMPMITAFFTDAFQKYQKQVWQYIGSWRLNCYTYELQKGKETKFKLDELNLLITDFENEKSVIIDRVKSDKLKLENILSEIQK